MEHLASNFRIKRTKQILKANLWGKEITNCNKQQLQLQPVLMHLGKNKQTQLMLRKYRDQHNQPVTFSHRPLQQYLAEI